MNAKQIRELMGLGIDGDVLVQVVAIFDLAELDAKQRSANRSKRYREKKNSDVASRSSRDAVNKVRDGRDDKKKTSEESVACEEGQRDAPSRDERDALLLTSLKKNSIEEETKKVRARRKSSVTLRDDWRPSESHFDAAKRMNIPAAKVYVKADDMRLWAKATDARKADWDATFHGFLRRDADKLSAGSPLLTAAEPAWTKPPAEFLERQRNAAKGTSVRSDAGVGNNGAGHAPELRLSGGGILRPEVGGTQRDAPDDHIP